VIATVPGVCDDIDRPTPARSPFVRRAWEVVLVAASERRATTPREVAAAAWRLLSPDGRDDAALTARLERSWPSITSTDPDGSTRPSAAVAAASVHRPETAALSTDADDAPGGLLVVNAGLVLVHPLLTRFLDACGVTSGDELIDPGRALCLLDHLATGDRIAPEHRLVLPKVLCGVALDDPVEADVGLTDADVEESTAVLEAAIRHWDELRGTSPASLRLEFLMRPGLLSLDADDWLLRVEERTVDILLDQLPWGISVIKLPWMDRMMRVEWGSAG